MAEDHYSRGHWYLPVAVAFDGERLETFLATVMPDLAVTTAAKLIETGGVHIDGRRISDSSRRLRSGETVLLHSDGLPLEPYRITAGEILCRDRDLIALNKPAGIETQPTPARYKGTLYEALGVLLHDPFRPRERACIGMVQRLDRETSGVILFSISKRAHKGLTDALAGRVARKRYLALVSGAFPEGEVQFSSDLARGRDNRVRSVPRGGQPALTRCRCLARLSSVSLIEAQPVTGRMHQIRVHLAEAGYPLLGDSRYGGLLLLDGVPVERHLLHARQIDLPHPVTGSPLSVTAPLPADLQRWLISLGYDGPLLSQE